MSTKSCSSNKTICAPLANLCITFQPVDSNARAFSRIIINVKGDCSPLSRHTPVVSAAIRPGPDTNPHSTDRPESIEMKANPVAGNRSVDILRRPPRSCNTIEPTGLHAFPSTLTPTKLQMLVYTNVKIPDRSSSAFPASTSVTSDKYLLFGPVNIPLFQTTYKRTSFILRQGPRLSRFLLIF